MAYINSIVGLALNAHNIKLFFIYMSDTTDSIQVGLTRVQDIY